MKVYKVERTNKETGVVYASWVVDLGKTQNGKRERHAFKTFNDAQSWLRKYKKAQSKYGQLAGILSSGQYALAVDAFKKLLAAGLKDSALPEAVDLLIARNGRVHERLSIEEAAKRYVEHFAENQSDYRKTVEGWLGKLATFFGGSQQIISLGPDEIVEFFEAVDRVGYAAKTYNNILIVVKAFFNWCVTKHYVAENPADNVSPHRIAYKDPSFVPVEKLRTAFANLEADTSTFSEESKQWLIGFMALSFFCGIRTSEIMRLSEDAIHPEDERPYVRISTTKGAAKGIKGRIVDLEPNAAAWLKKYPFPGGKSMSGLAYLRKQAIEGPLAEVAEAFSKNVGRHSYITYHTAKYRDYARTEAYVGTSSSMRTRHYQGLATTAEGEAYFHIFPS